MTRNLLFSFIFLFPFILSGQDTISTTWFPSTKEATIFEIAYPPEPIKVKEGANFICDFKLALTERKREVSIQITNSSDTSAGINFPNSDLCLSRNNKYNYYLDVSKDTLTITGFNGPYFELYNSGRKEILGFVNFKYGDTLAYSYKQEYFNIKSLMEKQRMISDTLIYSGYGTVRTYSGDYDNCVQIKRIRYKDAKPEYYEYSFYKNNFSNVIFYYKEYTSGNIEPVRKIEYPKPVSSNQ